MKAICNIATAIITGIIVGPFTWMLLDRDPPYIRESGRILPVHHSMCGAETGPPLDGMIHPGSCLEVIWTIVPLRICKPSGPFNVQRTVVDQQGKHALPVTHSIYSPRAKTIPPPGEDDIIRYFALPPHGPIGPATYRSSASFVCNWLQEYLPWIGWPIVVDMPSIEFVVGDIPTRGPH